MLRHGGRPGLPRTPPPSPHRPTTRPSCDIEKPSSNCLVVVLVERPFQERLRHESQAPWWPMMHSECNLTTN